MFLSRGATEQQALAEARRYAGEGNPPAVSPHTGRAAELHRALLALVEQHILQYSDVHYYAGRLNVSPRYLAQVTRRIAGQSPKAIIEERLAAEIERLLLTKELTVQEIAYRCGFSAQAHLTKFFKKQRGMSPTAFRKDCRLAPQK